MLTKLHRKQRLHWPLFFCILFFCILLDSLLTQVTGSQDVNFYICRCLISHKESRRQLKFKQLEKDFISDSMLKMAAFSQPWLITEAPQVRLGNKSIFFKKTCEAMINHFYYTEKTAWIQSLRTRKNHDRQNLCSKDAGVLNSPTKINVCLLGRFSFGKVFHSISTVNNNTTLIPH